MQFLLLLYIALFHVSQLSRPYGSWHSDPVLVQAVTNGDSITVQGFGRVSLLGIQAPAIGGKTATPAPFALEARERLSALVLNRWVRLETDGQPLAKSGSRRAYVMSGDGQFVNAVLVREGLARVAARTGATRLVELERAEQDAQQFRRGMWGAAPRIPASGYTPPPKRSR